MVPNTQDTPYRQVRVRRTFEEVALQLRTMLGDGTLRPGDRLPPERELSRRLGVSRSALREALRTLEIGGLLELRKGKTGGAFVTSGDPSVLSNGMRDLLTLGNLSFEELAEARLWIEELVVRIACKRATEADLQALEHNLRDAEALLGQGRYAEKTQANIEFHNILARATRNAILVMNVSTITEVMRGFAERVDEPTDLSMPERHRFIRALRARDEERAVKIILTMMRRWHRRFVGRAGAVTL